MTKKEAQANGDNLSPVDFNLKSTTNAAFNTLQIVTGSETVIAKYLFRGVTKMVDVPGGTI